MREEPSELEKVKQELILKAYTYGMFQDKGLALNLQAKLLAAEHLLEAAQEYYTASRNQLLR
jgi:hypothetical protein